MAFAVTKPPCWFPCSAPRVSTAYPVLVNVGMKRDIDVPEPSFNHAIVSVELKKGEYLLMDPTAENTKDLLPSYECDQSYLVCRPEGETFAPARSSRPSKT